MEYTKTSGNYTTKLTVNETSVSTADNTSELSWSIKIVKNAGTGIWHTSRTCPWYFYIDGVTIGYGTFNYDFRNYTELTVGSGTLTIQHNDDGKKSINVSAYVDLDNTSNVQPMTASGVFALTDIPRSPIIFIKINGIFKRGKPWVKVNGAWKKGKEVYVKVNGEWKIDSQRG